MAAQGGDVSAFPPAVICYTIETDSMPSSPASLELYGWNVSLAENLRSFGRHDLEAGRVAVEDKHHYILFTVTGPLTGKVSGKMLHDANSPADLPKVGDWVALAARRDEGKAVIHQVLPRRTRLSRKLPGRETGEQVIAANVDIAFLVQGLDRPFNPALLQRHLVMAREGGVKPVVVLNKADLSRDVLGQLAVAEAAAADAPVIAVSAKTGRAIDSLTQLIRPAETVVFIGPSGAGKSSLINRIYGDEIQATTEVRDRDAKGRHTTSWRELIVLPKGGLVIDTPGMREFHLWVAEQAAAESFSDIEALAARCRFRDCGHMTEKGCAVRAAVAAGELPRKRLEDYRKLERELLRLNRATRDRRTRFRNRRPRISPGAESGG